MSDYIPEEILKWLPAKALLRCRSVCKIWKEIIDSPLFHQHHLALQKPKLLVKYEQPELFILDRSTLPSLQSLTLPPTFLAESGPIKPHRIVGTLHGVVCLHDNSDQILIWNPILCKSSTISAPVFELRPYCGFWINPSTKHFKIIMVNLFDRDPCLDGYLYSPVDQIWRPIHLKYLEAFKPCVTEIPPVVIGGVAYWMTNCIYYDANIRQVALHPVVLSFDFASECFDSIKLPEIALYLQFHPTLCNLRDSLALVSWELRYTDRIDVHILVDNAWVHIMELEVCIAAVFRVSWLLGDTKETCRIVAETGMELVLYDAKDDTDVVLKSPLRDSANMFMAYDFVESLLFP